MTGSGPDKQGEAFYDDPYSFVAGLEPGMYTAPRWVIPVVQTQSTENAGTLTPSEPYTLPLSE